MEIKEKPFTCSRGGLTIKGMQYFPADFEESGKYPAVIASHGFTGNYLHMADFCREFARMGYCAFSFSFCGGGSLTDDDCVKSEGETTDMTISTEVEDLITVKNFVKSHPYIDGRKLVLMGISQGGFVSGLTAAKCGEEISKLIMIYPAFCIPDHARRGCLGGGRYDPKDVPEKIDCGASVLGKVMHDDVVGMDPYLELSAYQGPVLLLQGLEDQVVNYSYAVCAKEHFREGQCHLQLIRNMGHDLNEQQFESAVASIRQFLANREEILSIRVVITHQESVTDGDVEKLNLFFTGYCDTEYFQGAVIPEGCDAQEYCRGVQTKMRAEYTLVGMDEQGRNCSIHIVNQREGEDFKPVVETDSLSLAWLNRADLTAVLEHGAGGPTVRIYADRNEE